MTPIQSSSVKGVLVKAAAPSKKYGRYSIAGLLGEGSMGYVYRAHDPHIDRHVALKVLKSNHISSKKYVQRFTKEAKAIGRLSHPNIVTIHDVGQDHGTIYIAMELIEGKPLDQLLKSRQLDTAEVLNMGVQVAVALDYAHQKGVVHRDIKPSNMIMIDGGHIKLTDFGIAHLEDTTASQHTRTGDILGTPAYMSPEQIEGKTIDRRSDLFSLGVILYKLTAGEWPFCGESMAALFNAISNGQPRRPQKVNSHIPQALSALIMKSLEKNPDDRYQTGKEMASALRSCRTGNSKYPNNQTRKFLAYGLFVTMGLLGAGGWLASKHFSANTTPAPIERQQSPQHPTTEVHTGIHNTPAGKDQTASATRTIRAKVHVSSDPANAKIYIDRQLMGTTPSQLDLPMGVYMLRLNLPDYYETNVSIQISDPGAMPLKFRLAPKGAVE